MDMGAPYHFCVPAAMAWSYKRDSILEHRCSVRLRQEREDPSCTLIVRDRVRVVLGLHRLDRPPRIDIDDVDDAGVADGHVEMRERLVQEHDIRRAAQGERPENLTRARVD